MKSAVMRMSFVVALASMLPVVVAAAPEASRALPTLLIKGEVVSVDTNDPSANLLKVKDRYGFETPIYVTQETKINQGEAAGTVASLTTGAEVEVEYNFDVNTAKRHAVSVKVAAAQAMAPAAAAAPAMPAAAPAETPAPAASSTATPASSPDAASASQPAATPAPAEAPAAPAEQLAPENE